jgi:hypothetical protein
MALFLRAAGQPVAARPPREGSAARALILPSYRDADQCDAKRIAGSRLRAPASPDRLEECMLRAVGWTVGALVVLVLVWFGLQVVASESGEVVVLQTRSDTGTETTRLWVVERDGALWLRSGGGSSGWYGRLAATPEVRLQRGDHDFACRAESEPAERDVINALMAAKYGWRDRLIALLIGERTNAVPVRLRCVPAGTAMAS